MRSRKILTNCLALHALIALFPIPRAAANPLMTQPLIPGSTSNASPGANGSDMGTGRASHPEVEAATPSMPSGRTRWPDAGDRSAAGVSESLTGRVAGDGRQQISVAAPDRDSTAAEGRPSTDPTHLTAGVGEVNRAVGRSSAQAVGGVRNFVGVNDFEHGLGGPEGVGRSGFPINPSAPAPATTTAAGARTSANAGTSVPPAINPSAQVLGGTATTVGAASNSGVSSNAASTSSQAIGSPSIAGTTPGAGTPGQTSGGPSIAGNATAQAPGAGASGQTSGGPGIAGTTPGAGTPGPMAGGPSIAGNATAQAPGAGASGPIAGGPGIAGTTPGAGASGQTSGGPSIAGNATAQAPGAGTSGQTSGGPSIAGNATAQAPGAGTSGPAVGGSNSFSSTTMQTAVGTTNAASTNASSQAIGGLNPANNLAVANTMSQIVSVAVLNQALGAPSNTGAAAIKNSPATSDNTTLAASSDRVLPGDATGTNLPGVKAGVLGATTGMRSPLAVGSIADPARPQATLPPDLPQPAINASNQVRQDAGIGTTGGGTDHLPAPYPVPVPEPSPLALLGVVAVISAGRITLRWIRHRG